MFCPSCGSKNPDDANFCESCGLNFEKAGVRSSGSSRQNPNMEYEPPIRPEPQEYAGRSSILDGLEDAHIADYRDEISAPYYFLAFFIFPIGIFLWAFHRDRKPESAKNLLAASIAGFALILLLVV